MSTFAVVEKSDPLAIHGLFDCRERAEQFLLDVVPVYVARGYYTSKTLTADSFMIVEMSKRSVS